MKFWYKFDEMDELDNLQQSFRKIFRNIYFQKTLEEYARFYRCTFCPVKGFTQMENKFTSTIFFNRILRRKLCDSQGLILRTRQSRLLLLNDLLAWSRSVALARHRDIPLSLISVEYSRVRASKIESVIVLELSSPFFLSPLPSLLPRFFVVGRH